MGVVDLHPQKQEIIEALISGESLRKLGQRVVPPLHHTQLARYRVKIVGAVAQSVRGTSAKYRNLKELGNACDLTKNTQDKAASASNALMERVQSAIDSRLSRRNTWFADAERLPIRSEDGEILGYRKDHKALAAHDSNELRDLRTIAELGGLLATGAQATQVNVNAVVVMPSHQQESRDDGPVIDIDV